MSARIEPSPMDCAELERSLEAYLDGEFEGADRAETEAHIAACATCRARAEARPRAYGRLLAV